MCLHLYQLHSDINAYFLVYRLCACALFYHRLHSVSIFVCKGFYFSTQWVKTKCYNTKVTINMYLQIIFCVIRCMYSRHLGVSLLIDDELCVSINIPYFSSDFTRVRNICGIFTLLTLLLFCRYLCIAARWSTKPQWDTIAPACSIHRVHVLVRRKQKLCGEVSTSDGANPNFASTD